MVSDGVIASLSVKQIQKRWFGFSAFAHRAPCIQRPNLDCALHRRFGLHGSKEPIGRAQSVGRSTRRAASEPGQKILPARLRTAGEVRQEKRCARAGCRLDRPQAAIGGAVLLPRLNAARATTDINPAALSAAWSGHPAGPFRPRARSFFDRAPSRGVRACGFITLSGGLAGNISRPLRAE